MRFTVSRIGLARRLAVVERIIPKKGGLPGHHVVSVKASAEDVVLSVSAAKESYRVSLKADSVQTRGTVAIPALELIRIVEAAPGTDITIDDSEQTISVTSGGAVWSITPLDGGGYVAADIVLPDKNMTVLATHFVQALEEIRYAASRTEARPSLRQLHFSQSRAVAADGRRLHQVLFDFDGDFSLPEVTVDMLIDALKAEGSGGIKASPVSVYDTDQVVHFTHEGFVLSIGKLSYTFPDVDALILLRAREQAGALVMMKKDLLTALRVAEVSVGDAGNIEMVQLSDSTLQIKGTSTASRGSMLVDLLDDPGMSDFRMLVPVESLIEAVSKLEAEWMTARVALPDQSDPGWFYVDVDGEEIAIRGVTRA